MNKKHIIASLNNIANTLDNSCCYIAGCTQDWSLNYDPDACYDDGSCIYPVLGCTDPLALNYNDLATILISGGSVDSEVVVESNSSICNIINDSIIAIGTGVCTISAYKDGNFMFASGYGTEFTPYNYTHPLVGNTSPMQPSGIYTPIIDKISINGLNYSQTEELGFIQANLACFNSLSDKIENNKNINKILNCNQFLNKKSVDTMLIPKYKEWINIFKFV